MKKILLGAGTLVAAVTPVAAVVACGDNDSKGYGFKMKEVAGTVQTVNVTVEREMTMEEMTALAGEIIAAKHADAVSYSMVVNDQAAVTVSATAKPEVKAEIKKASDVFMQKRINSMEVTDVKITDTTSILTKVSDIKYTATSTIALTKDAINALFASLEGYTKAITGTEVAAADDVEDYVITYTETSPTDVAKVITITVTVSMTA